MGWAYLGTRYQVKKGTGKTATIDYVIEGDTKYRFAYNDGLGKGLSDKDPIITYIPGYYKESFAYREYTISGMEAKLYKDSDSFLMYATGGLNLNTSQTRYEGAQSYRNPGFVSILEFKNADKRLYPDFIKEISETSSDKNRYLKYEFLTRSIKYASSIYDAYNNFIGYVQYYPNDYITIGSTLWNAAQKTGYTFLYWRGNGIDYTATNKETIITTGDTLNSHTELKAVLVTTTYFITYVNNGGTSSNRSTYDIENSTFNLSDASRSYYTFVGWYTANQGGTKRTQITKGTYGNITLYARWTPVNYSISYDLVGGIGTNDNPTSYNIETSTFNLVYNNIIKNGYSTKGWHQDNTLRNSIIKGSTGNIALALKWDLVQYDIIYSNTYDKPNSNPTTYNIETEFILKGLEDRIGYRFYSWYRAGIITDSIPKGLYGTLIINAEWSLISYSITYNLNGGTDTSTNPTSYNIESNDINLTGGGISRLGYTFVQWNRNGNIMEIIKKGTYGNIVLDAVWNALDYKITYNNLQGTTTDNPTGYKVTSDDIILKNPTDRRGYKFLRWINSEGSTVSTIKKGSIGDIVLTAVWEIITYTITYDLVGGINNPNNPKSYTINDEITFLKTGITKLGYTFTNWLDESGQVITKINKESIGNRIIKAEWNIISYNINYDYNDDSLDPSSKPNNPIVYKITDNDIILLNPIRTGYTFTGWILDNKKVVMIPKGSSGDKYLKATWTYNNYQVTFISPNETKVETFRYRSQIKYNYNVPIKKDDSSKVYTFIGWGNNKDNDLVEPLPIMLNRNLTFYAKFSTKLKGIRIRQLVTDVRLGNKNVKEVRIGEVKIWEKD